MARRANQFELSSPPTDAISAVAFAPGSSTRLLVASWDRNVYLYDTHSEPGGTLIRKYEHRAPVLDVCFGADDNEAFTAGLDWDVNAINLENGNLGPVSTHTAGVKSVVYSPQHRILISASWDSTLHVHVPGTTSHTPLTIPLPSKPFSLSISPSKLVVAMASRTYHIYDLSALALHATSQPGETLELAPWQARESSLKFMTRSVACMPNDAGYACASIEGRVGVEWFDPSEESQSRKYAFKCHRQAIDGVDTVYPVNALAFHPVHGTFASGGGDGMVALWDGVQKRRIRQYQRFPASVAALGFSGDGKYLAVAVCQGFEDGREDEVGEGVVKVFVRELGENEAKGKAAK
ncbi:mitotic checkpoint protein-like protein BUB3 [Saccharata proteae CBS 121410]|uniref:Mitotic checkpoint protein-like protein BUB3 n=1 Tax=Saccharata proteae CBS 121410 TaxID=1314787 RepID=A0A9P4HPL3_9PEZI|nr:mitotic checkpoint protein-like protein BUB3 [Saccharata proteae CBS 121410]